MIPELVFWLHLSLIKYGNSNDKFEGWKAEMTSLNFEFYANLTNLHDFQNTGKH